MPVITVEYKGQAVDIDCDWSFSRGIKYSWLTEITIESALDTALNYPIDIDDEDVREELEALIEIWVEQDRINI